MILLSRSEELVLLAIWKLKDNAYGVTVRDLVSKFTDHDWSFGAVYKPLKQLVHKGYVEKRGSEPRAGRPEQVSVYVDPIR
jgi:PadR family transcriptional regulator PadR